MRFISRILAVVTAIALGAPMAAEACNQHPPDVAHERWLAQIAQWNKEYDEQQAAKAKAAEEARGQAPRTRERGRPEAERPAPTARGGGDPQVRSLGRQPQSVAPDASATEDGRRSRRYR
jgi:hypothetical protein